MNYTFNLSYVEVGQKFSDIDLIKNYCGHVSNSLANTLLFLLIIYILIEIVTIFHKEIGKKSRQVFYIMLFPSLLLLNSYTIPTFDFASPEFFRSLRYVVYTVIAILLYLLYRNEKVQKFIKDIKKNRNI